ncbi:MAG: bifunctional riboflavin kinase/FAD synthetase [Desulfovibrio sp.]|nr:bifunctional riboflavin kinase/FAD synthetase [Desulfovibrio sp.]
MLIARTRQEITLDLSAGSCVTIGNFDGVHKGHQTLITRVLAKAKARGLTSVVATFCPHPLQVLVGPHTPPFITIREQKLDLIEAMGVDMTLLLEFTKDMAAMEPEQFVKTYLVDWINCKELVVGYDWSFGKGRKGNFEVIQALGQTYGFRCERMPPVMIHDAVVSSTRIRDLIKAGDVWEARCLLGRYYAVRGTVIHGHNRGGRLLGFPTANLKLENEVRPRNGVYAVWVNINGSVRGAWNHATGGPGGDVLAGVANIGVNPTFGNTDVSVEVHILDFDADLYGKDVHVHFVQFIRPEQKFPNVDALVARITEDVALTRRILAEPEANCWAPA